jgi:hypothetical protein
VYSLARLVDQSIRMGSLQRFSLERSQYTYLVSRIKSALEHSYDAMGRVCGAIHDFKVDCGHVQLPHVRDEIGDLSLTMMGLRRMVLCHRFCRIWLLVLC